MPKTQASSRTHLYAFVTLVVTQTLSLTGGLMGAMSLGACTRTTAYEGGSRHSQ